MNMLSSRIISFINFCLIKIRNKFKLFLNESWLLKNIDNFIFTLIILLFILSAFSNTNILGLIANFILVLTLIKLIFVNGKKVKISYIGLMLLIYLLFSFLSVMNSTLFISSFKGFLKTLTYLGFYFSLCIFLKDNYKKLPLIIGIITCLVFYESVYALFQGYIGVRQISTWQDVSYLNPEEILTRAYGTLKPYNPNLLGGYLLTCLSFPLVLGVISIVNKNYKKAIISFIIFLTTILAIIQTGCRGAYLGVFTFLMLLMFLSFKLTNLKTIKEVLKKIYITFLSILTLSIFFFPPLQKRILSIFLLRSDSSTSFRLNVFNSSLEMLKDNFLFGIGTGNTTFREIYGLYMKSGFDALSAYNIYLETAVESGIFALISFIIFLFLCYKYGITFILNKSNNINCIIIVAGILLTLTAVLTHGIFDTIFYRPQIQFIFWLNIAILTTTLVYKKYNKC